MWVLLVRGERATRTAANGLRWASAVGVRNGNRAWRLDARRIHRTAAATATTTPPRRYVETLLTVRRTAVAAHARPRIELYGTSLRRRRCYRHGRRPETPPERSSAAAAVSRGTRVIVTALTHRTDFSVFILRPSTRDGFSFSFFSRFYSFCRTSPRRTLRPHPTSCSQKTHRLSYHYCTYASGLAYLLL